MYFKHFLCIYTSLTVRIPVNSSKKQAPAVPNQTHHQYLLSFYTDHGQYREAAGKSVGKVLPWRNLKFVNYSATKKHILPSLELHTTNTHYVLM